MAIVNTPLFSAEATGAIAHQLVYYKWKGIPVVRKYVIPKDPNTPDQQAVRMLAAKAVAAWRLVTAIPHVKDTWDLAATHTLPPGHPMSGWNFFARQWRRVYRKDSTAPFGVYIVNRRIVATLFFGQVGDLSLPLPALQNVRLQWTTTFPQWPNPDIRCRTTLFSANAEIPLDPGQTALIRFTADGEIISGCASQST